MVYKTKGVCAQGIEFEIDDNKKGGKKLVWNLIRIGIQINQY